LKNITRTLNLDHDEAHEEVGYLELIVDHPHYFDTFQAITSIVADQTLDVSYRVENQSNGISNYYHRHILLISLKFKRMEFLHQIIYIHR